jgi:antitoxin CcdA
MIQYEKRTEVKEFPISVTCDVCNRIYFNDDKDDLMEIQEFHHIRFRGGFGSVFGDDVEFKADICQHCLKNILGQYITVNEDTIL